MIKLRRVLILLGACSPLAVNAHTLNALPHGFVHELLHVAPVALPLVLVGLYFVRRCLK